MPSFPLQLQRRPPGRAPGRAPGRLSIVVTPKGAAQFVVSGQSVDSTGAPLASCIVKLFRVGDDSLVATSTSDGSGNYSFTLPANSGTFYVVSFNAAGTLAGCTLPGIVAV